MTLPPKNLSDPHERSGPLRRIGRSWFAPLLQARLARRLGLPNPSSAFDRLGHRQTPTFISQKTICSGEDRKPMSKALQEVRVGRKTLWALFDSGAARSYVASTALPRGVPRGRDPRPASVGLGGRERRLQDWCGLVASIDGCSFSFKAYVISDIGVEEGRRVDLLVGATVMEEWEIGLKPKGRRLVLDLRQLRKREFVDF